MANTDLSSVTTLPAGTDETLVDGQWTEIALPRDLVGLAAVSVKVTGDASIAFPNAGVSDGGAVSGTQIPITSAEGWLRWGVPTHTGIRAASVYLAGDGGTPTAYISVEGE